MSDKDALSTFDFSKFGGSGLFLKFEAGKPVTLRVLTVDPMVQQEKYEDEKTGEITLTTKFYFIVYNFTDEKAQILGATPTIARKIGELHVDPEFGSNIRQIDLRISPTGEKLTRRYDIQVLPKARELTNEQIKEAQAINLDEKIKDGERMSFYEPDKKSGYDEAKEAREKLGEQTPDEVVTDIGDEPIDLNDIPF